MISSKHYYYVKNYLLRQGIIQRLLTYTVQSTSLSTRLLINIVVQVLSFLSESLGECLVFIEDLLAISVGSNDGRLAVQQIDLLQRQTLGLRDEEVREDKASNTSGTPDEEHLNSKIRSLDSIGTCCRRVDKVWGGITNSKVPEPVACDSQRHALSANAEGEELSGEHPDNRAPGGGKEGNVKCSKRNQYSLS